MTLRASLYSSCTLALVWMASACSGAGATVSMTGGASSVPSTGGASSAGGVSGNGGSQAAGGDTATGGTSVAGGVGTTGGTESTGGASAAGGTVATGGDLATGGSNAAGGSTTTGGAQAAGGTSSPGGSNAAGGSTTTGGAQTAGGKSSTGGSNAAGGTTTTGGSNAAGGSTTTGGAQAAGGTSSTGGANGTGVVKSSGCGNTALPAACTSTTTGSCKLTINNLERTYYVVLPTNYDPNTAYPVVTGWHYFGGTAEILLPGNGPGGGTANFYGIRTGFPNAIYVTAQGLPQTTDPGDTNYVWQNTGGQDVEFAKAIISSIESNYCVDQSRIFATGMSYGGIMSAFLGCQAPDVFRALGIIAGGTFGGTQNCMNHPIAAWFTHGDADTTVPIANGITARDLYIKNNGCSTTNTESVVLNSTTTCTIYNDCTAGNYPVVWCPVLGGTHTIPSFSAAEITKFFMQF